MFRFCYIVFSIVGIGPNVMLIVIVFSFFQISYLCHIGGRNVNDRTKRILKRIFTEELASKF